MDPDYKTNILNEVDLIGNMNHPNIIKIHGFYEDDKRFYIVTDLCRGGELFNELERRGRFSEEDASTVIRHVLLSLVYIHSYDIVHRDIKMENFLLEQNLNYEQIKLIDF